MKNLFSALCLLAIATPALAAKSPKLVVSYAPNGQAAQECKLSEKEIKEIVDEKSDKGLCTKISAVSGEGEELIPETISKLVALNDAKQGKLSLAFTGTEGSELAQTMTAWMDFLAKQNKTGLWTATVVSAQNNVAVVQLANAAGDTINLQVILGFEIKKDKE